MEAIVVLRHSVRQLCGNPGVALRLAMLPASAPMAFLLLGPHLPHGLPGFTILAVTALGTLALLTMAAVGWHRLILLAEVPGLLPRPPWRAVLAYLQNGLGIAVIAAGAMLVLIMIGQVILSQVIDFSEAGFIAQAPAGILAAYLTLRLSVALPAVATGRALSLGEGWRLMAGKGGTLLLLAVTLAAIQTALSLGTMLLVALTLGHIPVLWGLAQCLAYTVAVMLWLSVLTTLYIRHVEGQPLR